MTKVKDGDRIKVHYTGSLENGTVFDTSRERVPLEFQVGGKQVIEGFEEAVIGMTVGEVKKVVILPAKAYGDYQDGLTVAIPRGNLDTDVEPKVGQSMELQRDKDQSVIVSVKEVTETSITVDANHPLAGEELHFEIEVVEIV